MHSYTTVSCIHIPQYHAFIYHSIIHLYTTVSFIHIPQYHSFIYHSIMHPYTTVRGSLLSIVRPVVSRSLVVRGGRSTLTSSPPGHLGRSPCPIRLFITLSLPKRRRIGISLHLCLRNVLLIGYFRRLFDLDFRTRPSPPPRNWTPSGRCPADSVRQTWGRGNFRQRLPLHAPPPSCPASFVNHVRLAAPRCDRVLQIICRRDALLAKPHSKPGIPFGPSRIPPPRCVGSE